MANQVDTRIGAGSIFRVRNEADDDWIETDRLISIPQGFGDNASVIDVSTAAGPAVYVGLADPGQATLNMFLNMDDALQQELHALAESGDNRAMQIELSEGTVTLLDFTAYVVDDPETIPYNDVCKVTVTIGLQSNVVRSEPV